MNIEAAGNIFPVIKGIRDDYDIDSSLSFNHLTKYHGKQLDYIPDLDGIIINDDAVLTDYVEGVINPFVGLIISTRLKEILEPFARETHQFFPANIFYRGSTYSYFYLHLSVDAAEWIDFTNSDFSIAKYTGRLLEPIKLYSLEDYREWIEENGKLVTIKGTKLIIKCPRDIDPDLFSLSIGFKGKFVSEKVKETIEMGGFTGMDFTEVKSIKFEQVG